MKERARDLSNIYGFARLYATLIQDGCDTNRAKDLLGDCYCANLKAYNPQRKKEFLSTEREAFLSAMETLHVHPYKTIVQTVKALELVMGNVHDDRLERALLDFVRTYNDRLLLEYGYSSHHPITVYSLCEDTLDPEREPERELNPAALVRKYDIGPKLVYISAPLRGNVEQNIAFAKEKAREVFEEGCIPICPHLLFPAIADPRNPEEDQKAMCMCLKLLERCNEVRLYGPEWSEGMWAELRHAEKFKIPILTDQQRIPQRKRNRELCR